MANLIGQILLNQFRVDSFVASGGMGAVYRVWDTKRNVLLAMKVLHAELAEDEHMFKRFQREANALKKLAHPNIVPFYGLYTTSQFSFLLEQFIDGATLQAILKERKSPLPGKEALIYTKAICAALGYAHSFGVVHCDIKPANVMVDTGGNIYLTDFGIARHAESTTTTFGAAGTPAYMAPEQIRGDSVSPATDVYALGVMLFEMLTGRRPFTGNEIGTENAGSTMGERIRHAHLHLAPPDPRMLNPQIPAQLAQVILKSLAKPPEERFSSTNDLFQAVCASVGANVTQVSERVNITLLSSTPIPASPVPTATSPVDGAPRRNSLAAVGVVLSLLAIGGVFWGFKLLTPSPTPSITYPITAIPVSATESSSVIETPASAEPMVTSATPSPTIELLSATLTPTFISTFQPVAATYIWESPSVPESAKVGPFLSLGVDAKGKFFLAYYLSAAKNVKLIERVDKNWQPVGDLAQLNSEGGTVGYFVTLLVDQAANRPHLSYHISDKPITRYAYLTSDGSWSTQNIVRGMNLSGLRFAQSKPSLFHFALIKRTGEVLYRNSNSEKVEQVESGVAANDFVELSASRRKHST